MSVGPTHLEGAFPDGDVITGWREAEGEKEGGGKRKVLERDNRAGADYELVGATRLTEPTLGVDRTHPDHAVCSGGVVYTESVFGFVTLCKNQVVAIGAERVACDKGRKSEWVKGD